jgi:hypothetical protein
MARPNPRDQPVAIEAKKNMMAEATDANRTGTIEKKRSRLRDSVMLALREIRPNAGVRMPSDLINAARSLHSIPIPWLRRHRVHLTLQFLMGEALRLLLEPDP